MIYYVMALFVLILAILFRNDLQKLGSFLTSTLHAFATEYNDAYSVNESENEEKEE